VPLREGVVFIGAHGVEDLATRHSFARLADRLAVLGHPVLRLDLPGTGDSLGDWQMPNLFQAWLDAASDAVHAVRSWSGVPQVGLMGLRLGGLVAALTAHTLREAGQPVSSLTLLAPVLQGRQHLRELRALSDGSQPLTVVGFPFSEATQQDLAVADVLEHVPVAPTTRVFLGVAGPARAADKLQALWAANADVVVEPYPGLAEHIGNPTFSQTPTPLFDRWLEWMQEGPAVHVAASTREPDVPTLSGFGFVEQAARIEAEVPLNGVWCLPQSGESGEVVPDDRRPIVLFYNAGRNPHTGWARGSVTLGRTLANEGILSLRFDLAGLGDSPPLGQPPAELLYNLIAIPQLRAVLDHVQSRFGSKRPIVVIGPCSGGYLAFHQAVADARIRGLVLVNVQKFIWREGMSLAAAVRTAGKSTQAYRERLFQADTWQRLLRGQVDVVFIARKFWLKGLDRMASALRAGRARLHGLWLRLKGQRPSVVQDPRKTIQDGFHALSARGTCMTLIYSEDDGGRDEFAVYFGADSQRFRRMQGACLTIFQDADHDLTRAESRAQLLDEIRDMCRTVSGQGR
jgi:alpha-beta hydrolase superfamily lysophospholipase